MPGPHLRRVSTGRNGRTSCPSDLPVAVAAGVRDVAVTDLRIGIANREQFMRAAMAIHTSSGLDIARFNLPWRVKFYRIATAQRHGR